MNPLHGTATLTPVHGGYALASASTGPFFITFLLETLATLHFSWVDPQQIALCHTALSMPKAPPKRRGSQNQASPAIEGRSVFLEFLDRFDPDACAEVLLSKVLAEGAAGALALTCSRLRQLVHGGLGSRLDFKDFGYSTDPERVERWTAALPDHFPRCQHALLHFTCERSFLVAHALMPTLSRLPQLSHVSLVISNYSSVVLLTMQLGILRDQLPQLHTLSIECSQPWYNASTAWQQLGSMTQLTRLDFQLTAPEHQFIQHYSNDLSMAHVAKLSALQPLQQLRLSVPNGWVVQVDDGLLFLSKLTSLTSLEVQLPFVTGLSSISSCTRLRDLLVWQEEDRECNLTVAECSAVSHLTHLTSLDLGWQVENAAVPVLYSALRKLPELQRVGVAVWTPKALQVFSGLTALTHIAGGWLDAPQVARLKKGCCPHVKCLATTYGSVPFEAFPKLEEVGYEGAVAAIAMADLAEHSPHIRTFRLQHYLPQGADYDDEVYEWWTLLDGETMHNKVAAMQGLAQLTGLTALELRVQDNAELAALASGATAVQQLTVVVPCYNENLAVTPNGLAQLGRLRSLQCLELHLQDRLYDEAHAARMMLCSLSNVECVSIHAPQDTMDVLYDVCSWARDAGLDLPKLKFFVTGEPRDPLDDEGYSDEEEGDGTDDVTDEEGEGEQDIHSDGFC